MNGRIENLPPGWVYATLEELLQPSRPRVQPADHPELRFVGLEHVEAHRMRLLGTQAATSVKSASVHFQAGDVLYGRLRPYLNKVLRPDFEGLCSAEFIVFPNSRHLDLAYIQYVLNSTDFVSFSNGQNAGDRPRVDFDQLKSYLVSVPPLAEQHRIVAEIEKQFTRLDASLAALEHVRANLKRYRAATLAAACNGRLVPTEAELARAEGREYESGAEMLERILRERRGPRTSDRQRGKSEGQAAPNLEELAELPEGWAWSTLGQAFRVFVGATPARNKPEYWNGEIPWVSSGEVAFCSIRKTRERITQAGLEHTSTVLHPPGTILLGMIGEGRTRGQAAILRIEACNNQNSAAIRVSETDVPPEYVYRFLEGQYENTRRVGSGNNQPALNKARVERVAIPIPPLAEQHRIVAEVERRLSLVEKLETVVDDAQKRAAALRQSILKRAFEGKLVPQDPDDEPADVLLERIRAERAATSTNGRAPKSAARKKVRA